jgi:phage terminase large subunit-like protein
MNPARKWDFLFRSAADPDYTTAKNFWEKEVKDNVYAQRQFYHGAIQ